MPLTAGTRLGPYEITSPLGAGGMGEVYRARDTRLDRDVAVKVLPQHLSGNPDLRARFEREARTASSLNHPSICTLFDMGHQDGIAFLVMELLEGETLAVKLERGPIAVQESLRHAIHLADALDRAHRRGLIHRDLKPGNIMITKEGAKLMDFGLAKASVDAPSALPMTTAPTMTSPLTAEGTLVGTFQYMAPEQLEGGEATARSDIFSFGAVLYEMLSGRRPFEGKTQASLAAAILKETPRPLSALQPMAPPALERLVATCMEKDPDERRQSMHDVLLELRWISEGGSQAGVAPVFSSRRKSRERLAWMAAAAGLILAAAAIALTLSRASSTRAGLLHVELAAPDGVQFDYRRGPMAISPDGSRIAFAGRDADGKRRLWVRPLDRPDAMPLEGTQNASYPFWSPDGRSIAFFADGKLKRIAAEGGAADTLCAIEGRVSGGSWGSGGTILFAAGGRETIKKISAGGGEPEEVTAIGSGNADFSHRNPVFLPDGRHFLYNIRSGGDQGNSLAAASLDGGAPKVLMEMNSNAAWAPPGYLIFWRDEALRAQKFDPDTLELGGEPFSIAQGIRFDPDMGVAHFSVSYNGVIASQRGSGSTARTRLLLFDRSGKEIGAIGPPGNFYSPRFSSDGRRVAVDNSGIENNGDIWVYEVGRQGALRLTSDPADESVPVWSPHDKQLAFVTSASGRETVRAIDMARPGDSSALLESDDGNVPLDWSKDGSRLLVNRTPVASGGQSDLWVLDIETGKAKPWLATGFNEDLATFSPDGRWVAFASNESGRIEVYVQPFSGPGARKQVSADGGSVPRWRADGREIFYVAPDARLMSVRVDASSDFETSAPEPLFSTEIRGTAWGSYFDVTADGQTFVVASLTGSASTQPMSVILGWPGRDLP